MDEIFTKVSTKKLILHKEINDQDIVLIMTYNKILLFDRNDLSNDLTSYQVIFNGQISRTTICDSSLRFTPHSYDVIVYPYLVNFTYEQMSQEPLELVISRNFFLERNIQNKCSLIIKLEKDLLNEYYITYYIHNRIIENVKNGRKEIKGNMLLSILLNNERRKIIEDMNKKLESLKGDVVLLKEDFNVNVSTLLKDNVKLYNYQEEDVKWMLNIKNKVEKGDNNLIYTVTKSIPVMNNNFIYNKGMLEPYSREILEKSKYTNIITYRGGNIVSEVGLGKTLINLCYIFVNSESKRNIYDRYVLNSGKCSYLYKRGKHKGKMCDKECINERLHCKLHKNTLFIDKPHLIFRNLEEFDIKQFIRTDGLIKTNASLVISPNHLCDQWVKEYYEKFQNNKRVVIVITLDQFKGLQLSDILFADIVVISYQLLLNINNKIKHNVNYEYIMSNYIMSNYDKMRLLTNTKISSFKAFYWENIILDEVHEVSNIYNGYKLKSIIDDIQSTCVWNVTGTPFPNGINSFIDLMHFSTSYKIFLPRNKNIDVSTITNGGLNDELIEICFKLFRRNTKKSVSKELKTNKINENVLKLKFTSQERNLYDSYKQNIRGSFCDFLIKICCHPELYNDTKEMIKNCKTLDEIQEVVLKHNKRKIDALKVTIQSLEKNIKTFESMLVNEYDQHVIENINTKISSTKKRLTNDKKTLSDITRTYQFLKKAIDELKNNNETLSCPICLDDIPEKEMTVTVCGHKFCWDCIYQNYKHNSQSRQFKCPFCKTIMDAKDVYTISESKGVNMGLRNELNSIINDVKSTKIGNIIYFLKNEIEKRDKIILFSQWDELLHKVGNKLSDYNLKISYCNGTVYQKKRAIDEFKNGETNIIMLSSRNAASGINLTNANKIIFLEPVYGTSEYRQDIEYQAIGRADRIGQKGEITVYRFIIRDTIEEDIIENNISIRQIT